jgi:hypothetical protein
MSTEAEAISKIVRDNLAARTIKTDSGLEYLIYAAGLQKHEVTDEHGLHKALPRYIHQNVVVQTVDSLTAYVCRFMNADTTLFADISKNSITGAIDYHKQGDDGKGKVVGPTAQFVAHCVRMELQFSQEWKLWTGINGRLMPQMEFARFIEENGADVAAPAGAELLEAVRDLQANRKVNFTKAVRTASDNENFEYTDETEARTKGGFEIPTKFLLKIPVYFGEEAVSLHGFLRWKLDDGALNLGIALHRTENVRQAVFKQIVCGIEDGTSAHVVFGAMD